MFGLAVFSVLGGIVWQTWAIWMNNANWLVAKTLLGALRLFDAVPGGSFHVESPAFWHWPVPVAALTVLDLGPGRAIALRAGRADWLVDTGRTGDYRGIVLPFLQACGIERLQALLLTEGDAFHLAGASLAMTDFRPAEVLLPPWPGRSPYLRDLRGLLADEHRTPEPAVGGTCVALGTGVTVHVLYPPAELVHTAAAGQAVIVRVDAAGWRILLLGDSNADSHRWLAARASPADLRSDIVVLGQPPETEEDRPDGGTDELKLLAAVQPHLLVRERSRAGTTGAAPLHGDWTTIWQDNAGAVTLRAYPDHLEASEFISGKVITLRPAQ
jgi:beta-lactamase superfamily II metal-dependent hydrolase